MKKPETVHFTVQEYQELKERILDQHLTEEDYSLLIKVLESNAWMIQQLQENHLSIHRLKKIFGIQTEKCPSLPPDYPDKQQLKKGYTLPKETKGHGRLKAQDYTNVDRIHYPLEDLHAGMQCPNCLKGKLYDPKEPGKVITIKGNPSLKATLHTYDRFRCSVCGDSFKPELPREVLLKKYDEPAKTIMVLLRYGAGFPLHRLEQFQAIQGVPLPRSTQWDCAQTVFGTVQGVWISMIEFAADGHLFHNDDTSIKILQCLKENKLSPPERKGMFTSVIVSYVEEIKIVLFFSSRNHAGENILDLLKKRSPELPPPIQMCDALSRNSSNEVDVILSHCLTHARRYFFDIYEAFPKECLFVLEQLKTVYQNDAYCIQENYSPMQRLIYHQENSQKPMEAIEQWAQNQLLEKNVEPNSSLGEAMNYFLNHYPTLTEFLKTPGVPLTNDLCERIIKTGIRHRKNSLFYKTLRGAMIGDCMMSLIQTCIQNKINPYDYLNVLQDHQDQVKTNPHLWFPWNYQKQLSNTS